jgi:hypothetical protein
MTPQPVPAGPPGPPPAKRYETLGTVTLVLALLEVAYCLFRLVSQLLNSSLIEAERAFFPSTPHGPPMGAMFDAARVFAQRIAPWEAARTVPFLVASAYLAWLALRLRRGDARALFVARQWVWAAFGTIALSLLIQVLVTMPATMEYQRQIVETMPTLPAGKGAPPFDMKQMMGSMTLVGAILGVVVGTVVLSVWPVVLWVWAGKLIRETAAPAAV